MSSKPNCAYRIPAAFDIKSDKLVKKRRTKLPNPHQIPQIYLSSPLGFLCDLSEPGSPAREFTRMDAVSIRAR